MLCFLEENQAIVDTVVKFILVDAMAVVALALCFTQVLACIFFRAANFTAAPGQHE